IVAEAVSIPLLHIADATAMAIKAQDIRTVGLLGTKLTMEEDFYRGRLMATHGLRVVTPAADDRRLVDRIIFDELCRGIVKTESLNHYLRIMAEMAQEGAEAIIAGCTEIGMLVSQEHAAIPLFDTTIIHVDQAIRLALAED
ncbi:MAG: Aspartate racemase, partial [uncultured bacterium]